MLGERLRQTRLAAGLSLEGLRARLDRPISKRALSDYERGKSQPRPTHILAIAAALRVPPSDLLAPIEEPVTFLADGEEADRKPSTSFFRDLLKGPSEAREEFMRNVIVDPDADFDWWIDDDEDDAAGSPPGYGQAAS